MKLLLNMFIVAPVKLCLIVPGVCIALVFCLAGYSNNALDTLGEFLEWRL